jgi:hypothetical protein
VREHLGDRNTGAILQNKMSFPRNRDFTNKTRLEPGFNAMKNN